MKRLPVPFIGQGQDLPTGCESVSAAMVLQYYINQTEKRAFPEMNQYDLALRLLGLLGSSTAAILQTIKGIVKRLQGLENAADELSQWQEIQTDRKSVV